MCVDINNKIAGNGVDIYCVNVNYLHKFLNINKIILSCTTK